METSNVVEKVEDIVNIFYINLDYRKDRKAHTESELLKAGFSNFTRFNAIRMKNGSLGCSLSHLKCLKMAKEKALTHILIVEDDIQFLDSSLFKHQLNGFLNTSISWDVILIAGNNKGVIETLNEYAVKVEGCQTTTGYLVLSHYYDKLIKNISEGIDNLIRSPADNSKYAIDQYWKHLQRDDKWFLITPLTVVQKDGYSDIEKRVVSYSKIMTTLDY
jgi:GR25 family glycosyltransferase involved in LPS biosynthesis